MPRKIEAVMRKLICATEKRKVMNTIAMIPHEAGPVQSAEASGASASSSATRARAAVIAIMTPVGSFLEQGSMDHRG